MRRAVINKKNADRESVKQSLLFLLFSSPLAFGQQSYSLDINILDLCPQEALEEKCLALPNVPQDSFHQWNANMVKVLDENTDSRKRELQLLCKDLHLIGKHQTFEPIELKQVDQDGDKWNIKFYFGYTKTEYFNSDIKLRSTRVNVDIKDFEWKERNSFEFFQAEHLKGKGNTFRFIDEPTNTFMINLEKGKDVFTLSLFHMKYLMDPNQVKQVNGTIDGVAVDKVMPVREKFDGYNNQPGEMHLWRLENTYRQVNPQIGYGRKIDIVDSKKYGKVSYTPSVQVGLIAGNSYSAYMKVDNYWESDNKEQKWGVKGATFSAGQRLEYEKGRVAVFMDQKFTTSKIKQTFLDGTATYRLNYMPLTLGVAVRIYKDPKVPKENGINDP